MLAKLIALVLPLGLDTFAVAAALGVAGVSTARGLRVTLVFTAFEAGMPLVGLALGAPLGHAIGAAADYVAIAVLLTFGLYMLAWDRDDEGRLVELAHMAGPGALVIGVSVSLDELAIGFTLGLFRLPAALVVVLIAVQAFALTQLGLRLGSRLGERVRDGAERLAGIALTALAVVLLVEKLV